MFANPIWSALILAVPFVLYFLVIRPRLRVKFTETYAHLDSFWARVWARTYAFRSFVAFAAGAIATALPDLLVLVSGMDLSFLPQPWPAWTMAATSFVQIMIRAFSTTPRDQPPA